MTSTTTNRYAASQAAFQQAQKLMPGGVNSPARAFGAVGGTPLFIEHAEGAYLYDLDRHKYIDYIGSWGPMILGHAHPKILAAIQAAAAKGTSFGAPTLAENELCELIINAIPSVEKVRLVSSGTEATMSAIRLARGYTGRDLLIKFSGNYHGHVDSLLVAAGSAAATLGKPDSPGVTAGTSKDTLVLPYNDPAALIAACAEHGSQIAAIIFEPIVGNMGTVIPTVEFIETLKKQASANGILLICDEVMTGFRVAYSGAQSLFDLTPDLTTMGKIVGGGLPVGAYGGRKEIMENVLPAGAVFQAGTLSGNPLATAAGITVLKILRDDSPYALLDKLMVRLISGLTKAATAANIPHTTSRVGSMGTFFFSDEDVTNWETASKCDTSLYAKFFWGLLDRGIYFPCSQYEAFFLSTAHTETDIDTTIAAATEVFATLKS